MFRRNEETPTQKTVEILRNVAIFRDLSRGSLRALAEAVHHRTYKRDEYVYYEDDPGLGMYIIQSGRIRLLIEDEDGEIHELRQVSDSEIFGQLSVVGEYRRMETAQALTETHVLGLFRPDLNTLFKRDPRAGADIVEALTHNLAALLAEIWKVLEDREGRVSAGRLLHGAAIRSEEMQTVPSVTR